MDYKYCWLYAVLSFLFILGIGFFYLLKPRIDKLSDLQNEQNELSIQMNRIKQQQIVMSGRIINASVLSNQAMQTQTLNNIAKTMQQQSLILESLTFPHHELDFQDIMIAHLQIRGKFDAIFNYLQSLTKMKYPHIVLDFNMVVLNTQQCRMTFDLLIFKMTVRASPKLDMERISKIINPFCLSRPISEYSTTNILSYSINEMKMVGFMHLNATSRAVILLPNGRAIDISTGMIIGKERGMVTSINNTTVQIFVQDKKILLKRQNNFAQD